MPVILEPAKAGMAGRGRGQSCGAAASAPGGTLCTWPVSRKVNSPANNGRELLDPVDETQAPSAAAPTPELRRSADNPQCSDDPRRADFALPLLWRCSLSAGRDLCSLPAFLLSALDTGGKGDHEVSDIPHLHDSHSGGHQCEEIGDEKHSSLHGNVTRSR
jgi:hypothetical protein